jgi:hypothetical protein
LPAKFAKSITDDMTNSENEYFTEHLSWELEFLDDDDIIFPSSEPDHDNMVFSLK